MMNPVRLLCLSILCVLTTHTQTHAQELSSNSDAPLEITADKTLEWDRANRIFTANGNAQARQGDLEVSANTLKATYNEAKGNNLDIEQVEALGNVQLHSRDNTAYGDKAVYNLKEEYAVLTGENLRMEAPNQKITAEERFEYWVAKGKVNAIGNPVIVQTNEKGETNTLKADIFTATVKENAAGKTIFHTLEARGNVIITTPSETLTGTYGIYNAQTNTAEVSGGVRLKRGPNILEGEKAQVNLNTSISKLIGSGTSSGRVRGVFYPGKAN